MLDDQSIRNIEELEILYGRPSGIGRIHRGECPIGALNPMGCMLCSYGHMLECHHPYTCEEAECSHYQQSREESEQ